MLYVCWALRAPCGMASTPLCVQVYKGRRKCTGQITAMKFILKQVCGAVAPPAPHAAAPRV